MEPSHRWMPSSVCFIAALALILPLIAALPMTHAQEEQATVNRLSMGLISPYHDYAQAWIDGAADHNIQRDPILEWLFEIDPETGQVSPWLAKSWALAPDGKSCRLRLQENAPCHNGYGEFTAKDVIHNHARWRENNDPGRKDPTTPSYRNDTCAVERIVAVNDHKSVDSRTGKAPSHFASDQQLPVRQFRHPSLVSRFHPSGARPASRLSKGLLPAGLEAT